ncbi:DUF3953 domain-containing protein [Anaerotignum propionicum]|uniref:DUF3953 domain-containing protein n=1 Tax=Anaerotignum propionicum TaxID=28446 RepID=UPI00210B655A|nr:DUF3953 domain-containing protein [Anaerotignum propionicum]MCQ4935955.1 DUF3953 domain-containing protein [Anaerotignum propionicum]
MVKRAWYEMQMHEKIASILGSICSVCIIILASLQLLDIWDKAIYIFEPLVGVLMVTQGVLQWRKNKTVAVFSLCVAIFIFIVAFIIYYKLR